MRCNFRKHMQIEKAPAYQENIFISLPAEVCTMMVDEQIQTYRIRFELTTKPLQSGFVCTMKLIINFLCQLRLDPELMERVHMNVWHQRRTANHNTEQVRLTSRELKVKNMRNLNAFTLMYLSTKEDK